MTIAAQYSLLALAGDLFGRRYPRLCGKALGLPPRRTSTECTTPIARRGYGYSQQAFFPLVSDHHDPHHDHPRSQQRCPRRDSCFAGFFLAGLFLFTKLALLDYSPTIVKWTVLALLFFPPPVFFSPYTPKAYFS